MCVGMQQRQYHQKKKKKVEQKFPKLHLTTKILSEPEYNEYQNTPSTP